VIHFRAIGYVLGQFLLALAGTMLVPLAYGLFADGNGLRPLGFAALITAAAGAALYLYFP
jgi:hypothetical protein